MKDKVQNKWNTNTQRVLEASPQKNNFRGTQSDDGNGFLMDCSQDVTMQVHVAAVRMVIGNRSLRRGTAGFLRSDCSCSSLCETNNSESIMVLEQEFSYSSSSSCASNDRRINTCWSLVETGQHYTHVSRVTCCCSREFLSYTTTYNLLITYSYCLVAFSR